ncbi:MFS transporter [Microbulbifer sp. 2201CG32-9]|uniref:MFS transporter n=1 Tax=Microbulbifer sp. 2201CG32-9 TaxID=3232309 RepID=UPI00345BC163
MTIIAVNKSAKAPTTSTTSAKQWAIPLALLTCVILSFFDKISIAVLLAIPAFQADMGVVGDTTKLGWLMSAFLISYGFSSMFLSSLADVISPKRCLYAIMIVTALIMALMGLVDNYQHMLTLRIVLGVVEGPLFGIAYAIVKRSFPLREQARATMLWIIGTPIGAMIGFPLTFQILQTFGWRATFFTMALLTIPILLLMWAVFRNQLHLDHTTPEGEQRDRQPISAKAYLSACRELLANTPFVAVCLFNAALLSYLWGLNSWLPTYLTQERGVQLRDAGLVSAIPFVSMLLGQFVGASLSDRYDRRALMCALPLIFAGVGILALLAFDNSVLAIAALAFSTFCWGMVPPSIFTLVGKLAPADKISSYGGVANGFGNLTSAFMPVAIGALIAFTGSVNFGLLFMALLALIGGALLLPLVRRY